jgi:hypothetical protein
LAGTKVSLQSLLCPWPIGAINASIDKYGNFTPDKAGERVFTFVCFDCGIPIDIAAWALSTGRLATYRGVAYCLGDQNDCFNPANQFDDGKLRVHATPLEWLQYEREGICIINHELDYGYLKDVNILVSDERLARKIDKHRRPKPLGQIFIEVEISSEGRVAA